MRNRFTDFHQQVDGPFLANTLWSELPSAIVTPSRKVELGRICCLGKNFLDWLQHRNQAPGAAPLKQCLNRTTALERKNAKVTGQGRFIREKFTPAGTGNRTGGSGQRPGKLLTARPRQRQAGGLAERQWHGPRPSLPCRGS